MMRTHQPWKESINEKLHFMNVLHDHAAPAIDTANHAIKPVDFYCAARRAKTVYLSGDFNHWHPILMERQDDGWWHIQLWLPHGRHQYRFLVDGAPTLDPHAAGTARDARNKPASLIVVG